MRFFRVHPATRQQQVASDVRRQEAWKLHRTGIGQDAERRVPASQNWA